MVNGRFPSQRTINAGCVSLSCGHEELAVLLWDSTVLWIFRKDKFCGRLTKYTICSMPINMQNVYVSILFVFVSLLVIGFAWFVASGSYDWFHRDWGNHMTAKYEWSNIKEYGLKSTFIKLSNHKKANRVHIFLDIHYNYFVCWKRSCRWLPRLQ